MVSAVEAETGAVFKNCQAAVTLRITLLEIGHKHPATLVHVPLELSTRFSKTKVKSHGHAFLLDPGSGQSEPVPHIFGKSFFKSGQLFFKTSSFHSSSKNNKYLFIK